MVDIRNSDLRRSDATLYKRCVYRVYDLLESGMWSRCSPNPFSSLPCRIIDDLMERAKLDTYFWEFKNVIPLLTSGRLTRLSLQTCGGRESQKLLETVIRSNCGQYLKFLKIHAIHSSFPLEEELIRSCPNLEEFSASFSPNFEVFRNCKELRSLNFYECSPDGPQLSPADYSALASLKNLKTFSALNMSPLVMAKVLEHCPHLVSLESDDSLDGLKEFHDDHMRNRSSRTDISARLQLRQCVWGIDNDDIILLLLRSISPSYQASFAEKVRIAVSLCPFVEQLVIHVYDSNALQELKNLKQLIRLRVNFLCDGDYLPSLIGLLKVIGPQLRRLSLKSAYSLPVDVICDLCPDLHTLVIDGDVTLSKPEQPPCYLPLEKLQLWQSVDRNSLLFLLSSCHCLKALFLSDALCLDNALLSQILGRNPLKRLEVISTKKCSLSTRGFRMLFEKAVSLESVYLEITEQSQELKRLIDEMNLVNLKLINYQDLIINKYFSPN